MLVYRVCDIEEIAIILKERSLSKIGQYHSIDKRMNTHEYKKDKKYIHFFKTFGDILYFDSEKRKYVCIYDINEEILENSKGIGYYLDRSFYHKIDEVEEFAIESDLIKFKDLKQIDEIVDVILFEDYLDNNYQDKITTIYKRNKGKALVKKRNQF